MYLIGDLAELYAKIDLAAPMVSNTLTCHVIITKGGQAGVSRSGRRGKGEGSRG